MRHCLLFLSVLTVATPGVSQLDSSGAGSTRVTSAKLDVAAARADVALMRRALETIHPGLYRYRSKAVIDRAFARLEAATATPIDILALHREIALMLAAIRCDHTKPELPAAMAAYRNANPTHLPLRFRLIEGRMIVTANDGQPGAPPVGSELVRINGMAVPRLLLTLAPAVAYDGDTDQAIAAKLADDSDLSGDDFNEYYPSFFGFPTRWSIDWKAIGARAATSADLAPITFERWTRLDPSGAPYRDEFYKSITWRIAGKAARLKIDTFVNYRNPVQPTAFLAGFFRAMKTAGTEHLILDLRNNGGGSEDVSVALARYLFDRPFLWSKPVRYKAIRYGDLPKFIDSWGDRDALFNPPVDAFAKTVDGWFERNPPVNADERDDDISTILHQPASADRFTGRLTILTGPANASGATRTVAQLKENRNATLVGEDSAGSAEGPTAGRIFLVTLPHSGIKVRVPSAWNRTNLRHFRPRMGVAVDRLVVPTLADFASKRDAALDIARAMPVRSADPARLLAAALAGNWSGTLDYRDYGNDGRTVLAASLAVAGLQWNWTFDDGPGKIVRSAQSWGVASDGQWLIVRNGAAVTRDRIVALDTDSSGGITMVADGTVREIGSSMMSRKILTQVGDTLRLTLMTRVAGEPYLMRHSYEMKRVSR
ncbi:MAG: S41 family peptidase [Pseudomonadota bacterium]